MAKVFIPTMLQTLTGGVKQTECQGRNVRQIIDGLEAQYPGIKDRLVEDGEIRSNLAVAIDGDVARMGMLERVSETAKSISCLPSVAGKGCLASSLSLEGEGEILSIGRGQAPARSIDWPDCGRLQYPQVSIL